MVDLQFHKNLEVLHVAWGDEHELVHPTYAQLADCLNRVRLQSCVNHCIECEVQLLGELDVKLYLMRINELEQGDFLGWLVQLSSRSDFDSFLLANTAVTTPGVRTPHVSVEMLGCCEEVAARCIFSHTELLRWIRNELMGSNGVRHYRWIDLGLALRPV